MIYNLLRFGIIPVFIFDGKPLAAKKQELCKRTDKRNVAQEKVTQLESEYKKTTTPAEKKRIMARIVSYKNQLVKINAAHINLVKKLLLIHRLKWFDAPNDAEALACYLNKNGKVDFVITEDSDCLVFDCKKQLKGYTNRKFSGLELLVVKDMRAGLGFTHNQMIDLAILLGNDYSPDLVPPGKAWDLINQYSNIEEIIKNLDEIHQQKKFSKWVNKLDLLKTGDIDYKHVREIFTTKYNNLTDDFEKPTKHRKFSPKRIEFLTRFLIKHSESKTVARHHAKIFKFLAKSRP